jgi:threonine dehydrogenase-like Zn-dependent dehydrogenase
MRGLVFPGDRQARIEEFDDPQPGVGEVVVAIRAAAICGSDMHGYRATAAERRARFADRTIPGHEPAGVVHAIGTGVTKVKIGDRVAVYHWRGCGYCEECRSGRIMWCGDRRGYGGLIHGSDAEYLLTDARNCLPLPEDASFALGALLMCVGGTGYEAMQKLGAGTNRRIAIFGMGPVGMAGLLFAKAMGAEVIGIDVAPHRLELGTSLGADAVIDSSNEDVRAGIMRWSGKDGVSGSFETSGVAAAQAATLAVTSRGGRIVFVGFGSTTPSITPADFIEKQLSLMGSFVFPIDHYFPILDFVRRSQVQLEAMVTHTVSLAEAPDILPAFDRGDTGKVIITP